MPPKSVKTNGKGASAPKSPPAKRKAAKKASAKKSAARQTKNTSNNSYIRNLHYGAGGARIDFDDRRIQLEPRGHIGDLVIVTEDDREDPLYQRNIGVIFEELTLAQGREVIDKQNTNAQAHRGPSTMDYLRNEKGEKYSQVRATIEPSFEQQGTVVANVVPAADGKNTTGNVAFDRPIGPEQVEVPGSQPVNFDPNVMPAGLSMEQAQLFMQTPPENRHLLLQQFQQEEAEGYRNELNVQVAPPEQT